MDEQKPPSEEKDTDAPGERGAGQGAGGRAGAVPPTPGVLAASPSLRWLTPALPAADGAVASEEMGSAEGDPLKPPEGASAGPEPGSTETKGPPQASR